MAFGARGFQHRRQTLEPLAQELGVDIHNEPTLTEEAYSSDHKAGRNRILELAARAGTPAICTQGKVIPDPASATSAKAAEKIVPSGYRMHRASSA